MDKTKYKYINEQTVSPSLICPICLEILEDPYTHIQCDSAFCRKCLLQLAEPVCPICRWYWDNISPIEYNQHLKKSNRLIRNMLDELNVECLRCHRIINRGQFEHECQPIENLLFVDSRTIENIQLILSLFVIFVLIIFVYRYRNFIFETAIDRRGELVNGMGTDIDKYLFNKLYNLIIKLFQYSTVIFLSNLFIWFCILFYGERFISKRTSRLLKRFLEISMIVNLLVYAVSY